MSNPLKQYFRQPAMHIKLPSNGHYWPEGSIEYPITGEIPVLPMTAQDDLILKTPDALLNGSGLVSLIHSCCPNIKNAWHTPVCDMDAILVAIRIASYGSVLKFASTCPKCSEDNAYEMDLSNVFDSLHIADYDSDLKLDGLSVRLKPQNYQQSNRAGQIAFEEQQTMRLLVDQSLSDEDRQKQVNDKIQKIHGLTIDTMSNSTRSITINDGTVVTEVEYIREFYQNTSNGNLVVIRTRLEEIAKEQSIKPIPVKCNECQHSYSTNFDFNQTNFFAIGS